jgi:peptidoglycan/xylan/chitin deacetylase (PgdA/CDA1 family)
MRGYLSPLKKRFLIPIVFVLLFVFFYRTNYQIPILMYHRIDFPSEEAPGIFVTPATFERQMEFLKVHRYNVLSLSDYAAKLKSGEDIPSKTVVITFDDGHADNFTNAFPVLRQLGFPATIFMITSNIGAPGWLTKEDIQILDESGISIGSHTLDHTFIPKITSDEEVRRQIVESKTELETILGHPVDLFSYPAGGFTQRAREIVKEAGYRAAVTTNHGKKKHDVFALHRIKIKESSGNLFNFWIKTSGLYHVGKKRIEVG